MDKTTKIHIECPILCYAAALNDDQLPTIKEILHYFELIRSNMLSKNKFNPSIKDIIATIVEDLKKIWGVTQIPILTDSGIAYHLSNKISELKSIRKRIRVRHVQNQKLKEDIEKFSIEINNLFCITACKCEFTDLCSCDERSKIPATKLDFLQDQKTSRNQTISSLFLSNELPIIDLDNDESPNLDPNITDFSPQIDLDDNEPPSKKSRKDCEPQNIKKSEIKNVTNSRVSPFSFSFSIFHVRLNRFV